MQIEMLRNNFISQYELYDLCDGDFLTKPNIFSHGNGCKELTVVTSGRIATGSFIRFMDRHSGGGSQLGVENIYIEGESEKHAIELFEKIFGISPFHITCECCGEDFDVAEVALGQEIKEGSVVITKDDISRLKSLLSD